MTTEIWQTWLDGDAEGPGGDTPAPPLDQAFALRLLQRPIDSPAASPEPALPAEHAVRAIGPSPVRTVEVTAGRPPELGQPMCLTAQAALSPRRRPPGGRTVC